MKKIFLLVMVLGGFLTPAMATTFDFPYPMMPVYVSGTADGKLMFGSADPANLDLIDGVVQFHNDIIKSKGQGLLDNAWRPARRISPNLLEVQLFRKTLPTQFAFNVKHGPRWGLIPSCAFIPDGKTVVVELCSGGHHFSIITHLKDRSSYKAVAMLPCPEKGDEVSVPAASSSAVKKPIEERDLPAETVVKKTPTSPPVVAATSTAPAVKKPKVEKKKASAVGAKKEKCDPCAEIATVEADTEAIQKAIGTPSSEEENIMSVLKDIQKKVIPPPPAPIKKPALLEKGKNWFWLYWIVGTLVVAFLMYWIGEIVKGSQPNTSTTPNPPPATQPEEDEEVIPLTDPADPADPAEEEKEPPHFI